MEIKIDKKAGTLYVKLKRAAVARTGDEGEYSIDYDKRGGVVGFGLAGAGEQAFRDLVLKSIQHPDENVRDAAILVGDWLNDEIRRRRAVEEYKDFVRAIELLLDYFDNGGEEEARYIDEMKSSPQKSLEILLDRVAHAGYELEITHVPPPDILARREKLETRIAELLEEAKSDFCFHDILEQIYLEEGPEDLHVIIEMFDGEFCDSVLAGHLEEVVSVVNDAWNYFPHAVLDGLCPVEKIAERG